jgi:glyoxylase-like metal-dependent hydrolase (beta-lactamase superfamily II)
MRVHHLQCGAMHPVGFGKRHMVCHCLLIETPSSGLVLVDSGFGRVDFEDPTRRLPKAFSRMVRPDRDPGQAAIARVEALGFSARDVRHIVLTHLDLDHAGGLVDFPDARVHVHALEHEIAMQRTHGKVSGLAKHRYVPAMWAHDPTFSTYSDAGSSLFGFEAVRDLHGLPPEILLIPLHGHSRGHSAVAVQSDAGWLVHAGDAYFDQGEVHGPKRKCPALLRAFQSIVEFDRKARLGNQTRLRELAQAHPEVAIFSAHDPRELPA